MTEESISQKPNTIIIGGGPAGIATAACLKRNGLSFTIIEKNERPGDSWARHYDRLHLHTTKKASHLPYLKFNKDVDRYPSREDVVHYLKEYINYFQLKINFGEEVKGIFQKDNKEWIAETDRRSYQSQNIVIATGTNREPYRPSWKGLESFEGNILHSSEFKNGEIFRGKKVLVVGFGNSACEQAICLTEHGASVSMSVRSPVNIVARDTFGFNSSDIGYFLSFLPPSLADKLSAPIRKKNFGDLENYGLELASYGPVTQVVNKSKIPLLDIGTVDLIRKGKIKIYPDISHIKGNLVCFKDKQQSGFDAILLGTGYRHNLNSLLKIKKDILTKNGYPESSGTESSIPGLYFCGFNVSPNGMLRQIRLESKQIAKEIKTKSI